MILPSTRLRALRSPLTHCLLLSVGLALSACENGEQTTEAPYGTESHFLLECESDAECGETLDCLGGRCSLPCTSDSDCRELDRDSVCAPTPGAGGLSCDAPCGDACDEDASGEPEGSPEPAEPVAVPEPTEPNGPATPSAANDPDAAPSPEPEAANDPAVDSGTTPEDAGPTTSVPDASVEPEPPVSGPDAGATPVADRACITNDDCALAVRIDVCCPGCEEAFSAAAVAAEECLFGETEAAPNGCTPSDCPVGCPGVSCAETTAALCISGECTAAVSDELCPSPCEASEYCVYLADSYQCIPETCEYDRCHPERCDQIGENCCDPFPSDSENYCNGGLVCGGSGCEAPADVPSERLCGSVLCEEGDICCDSCLGSCVDALSGANCPIYECSETFACGDLQCDLATEYCERFTGGPVPADPAYTCYPFSDACLDTPTCACLAEAGRFGECTASSEGGLTVEETAP